MRLWDVIAAAALAMAPAFAGASSLTTLYTFQGGSDGAAPVGRLTAVGNELFGATRLGGKGHSGTLYSLTPGSGGTWQETVLYAFHGGLSDAAGPVGSLLYENSTLYGTAFAGGPANDGAIFGYSAGAGYQVLHFFTGGTDGAAPAAPLIRVDRRLYGTTRLGGGQGCFDQQGCGTIYDFDPATNAVHVLYAFQGGADGAYPKGPLTRVGRVLYGTTGAGGTTTCFAAGGCGTVFKFDLDSHTYTQLHAFQGGQDGALPVTALTVLDGMLLGTTVQGGGTGCNLNGCGTIYGIDLATGTYQELFAGFGAANGYFPSNGLQLVLRHDAARVLRHDVAAPAPDGGKNAKGVIFSFDPATRAFSTLYTFTGQTDGATPRGPLLRAGPIYYGTTYQGGSVQDSGTVFSFQP